MHSSGSPLNVLREHPALRLELLDAAAEPAFGDKQRAVLAARDGARGVDVAVGDLREAGRRIELDDVARVVVREQQRAVLAGDRAVDVVALPRPDDLPALYRLQHSGNRRRRRQHGSAERAAAAAALPALGIANGCGGFLHCASVAL